MALVLVPFLALSLAAAPKTTPAPKATPRPVPTAPAGAPSPSPTSMPTPAPSQAPKPGLPAVITGVVRDAGSKEPIGGALMKPDIELMRTVKSGRGMMPAYQGMFTETEILDVIAYLRTLRLQR